MPGAHGGDEWPVLFGVPEALGLAANHQTGNWQFPLRAGIAKRRHSPRSFSALIGSVTDAKHSVKYAETPAAIGLATLGMYKLRVISRRRDALTCRGAPDSDLRILR